MIRVYNTLSGEKEPLPDQKKIRLFVCGPTVYDYLHIGNARTYVFFDFFARYLRSQGYEVEYVQNITDIDDKIIKRAAEEKKAPEELAEFFTEAYYEDMKTLGVHAVTHYAPATKFISQIVAQVERLIDKGFVYKIEGDGWYFDISRDEDYGKLSHRTSEQAEDATSRIDESVSKRNKGDFCVWKFSKENEPSWNTSLGLGRPGWHIEDTAISEFYFGPQYEMHGGGIDLKFPHHEAEIAQQESASGLKPFVRTWIHTGALLVESKKMSKSAGNFITIRDFINQYPPAILRWITLAHHYRSPIDFSDQTARQAKATLETIRGFLGRLAFLATQHMKDNGSAADAIIQKTEAAFTESLSDDMNTPAALAHVFGGISEIQPHIWNLDPGAAKTLATYIAEKLQLLGFSFAAPEIPQNVRELADEREQSRGSKQFEQSDRLRKTINDLGYDIEDTPRGPFIWPQSELLWHSPKNHN
jgi:cysteinyl-tRNA synthetase